MAKDSVHLDAIRADPDDDAPRTVYADLLQDRGDPRGEFIALQLARAAGRFTREGMLRERELLAVHGERWAGPLARWFSDPAFERGFFAGGQPKYEDSYARLLSDPWWPTITRLDEVYPQLVGIHTRRVCVYETELAEAAAAAPNLVELDLKLRVDIGKQDRKRLREGAGLKLRALGVPADSQAPSLFGGAPVLERIATLRITGIGHYYNVDPARELVAAATKRKGALRAIELVLSERRAPDVGWFVRIERDTAPGPFTRLRAWWLEASDRAPKELADDCNTILAIAGRELRDVEVELGRPMRLPPDTVRYLVEQLEARPHLERVQVPWAFARGGGTTWDGSLRCEKPLARIGALWKTFAEDLGATFDTYSVNDRGTPKLGKAPAATLATRARAAATKRLALGRTGAADHVTIHAWGSVDWALASARSSAELAAWFVRAITAIGATHAGLSCGVQYDVMYGFPLDGTSDAHAGWLVALGAAVRDQLAPKARAAFLAAHRDVRLVEAPDHLVLQIGATPADATDQRVREVAAGLVAALDASVKRKPPAWFARLVAKHLAPVAKRVRLGRASTTPLRIAWGTGDRFVVARVLPHEAGWRLFVQHAGASNGTPIDDPIDDQALADELLGNAARDLRYI